MGIGWHNGILEGVAHRVEDAAAHAVLRGVDPDAGAIA